VAIFRGYIREKLRPAPGDRNRRLERDPAKLQSCGSDHVAKQRLQQDEWLQIRFVLLLHRWNDGTLYLYDEQPAAVRLAGRCEESSSLMKPMTEKHLAVLRRHMVDLIAIHADLASEELGKSALDERVMEVMQRVPRHMFVPSQVAPYAYQDMPLPIGFDKTVSQPFMVALMTDLLDPQPNEAVLEIGTGLGYQTSILAELAGQIWSVEIVEEFARHAEGLLKHFSLSNVGIRVGDGSRGWSEHAPFDKVMATVAPKRTPPAWIDQLKPGGRIVLPIGAPDEQWLTVIDKDAAGQTKSRKIIPVRFSQLETV
jgi:protein-L-isoaspartate(D-aspartate) O-methyltransferase